ncbi:MAG: hypothetical protein U5K30_12850 [Acidimicrobiales bacterium]|nr:hypothetical protein [Acidimicrobiales bacterium]
MADTQEPTREELEDLSEKLENFVRTLREREADILVKALANADQTGGAPDQAEAEVSGFDMTYSSPMTATLARAVYRTPIEPHFTQRFIPQVMTW